MFIPEKKSSVNANPMQLESVQIPLLPTSQGLTTYSMTQVSKLSSDGTKKRTDKLKSTQLSATLLRKKKRREEIWRPGEGKKNPSKKCLFEWAKKRKHLGGNCQSSRHLERERQSPQKERVRPGGRGNK